MKKKTQQQNSEQKISELQKELENKNRELEIEASLERVRYVAMGMKKRDDMLKICKAISQQLKKLGVKEIRNVQTAIFYPGKGTYMNYEYYAKHNKTFITDVSYKTHRVQQNFAQTMMKGEGASELKQFKGKKLKDWYAYQKTTNQFADKYLLTAHSLNYYWYSLGVVAMGISTYQPLSKGEQELFARFRNVFELAYKRYIDIEKAEANAREAKIEASLERVRAIAMGMMEPDDLLKICETLFKEFQSLGFSELRNAMINIHNDEKGSFVDYDYSDTIGKSITQLNYNTHPVMEKQIKQSRKKNDAFSEAVYKDKDLVEWKKFRKQSGEKDDPRIENIDALYYYFYSIGDGTIGISTFSPIAEEKLTLLKRFRNVFSLAYKRYHDISLAKAQARETEIQLALERVRARTMAMQNSGELADAAAVLFQQFAALGITPKRCFIGIIDKNKKSEDVYLTNNEGKVIPSTDSVSMMEQKYLKAVYNAWKNKKGHISYKLQGQQRVDWTTYIMNKAKLSLPEYTPDKLNIKLLQNEPAVFNYFFFSSGYIGLHTLEDISEAEIAMLKRFSTVFEQTYTRFLDLEKAEAQAREAQIEAALERVRSKTMAMYRSEQLAETAKVLFEQFDLLGIYIDRMSIGIFDEETNKAEFWLTDQVGNKLDNKYFFPLDEPTSMIKIYNAWQSRKDSVVVDLTGNELKSWLKFINENVKLPINVSNIKDRRVHQVAFFSSGFLMFTTSEPVNEEKIQILVRFAKVFDLTYTRFQDLQKAEAQTRESEIQLALERVRARTLAMQNSGELVDAAAVVFQQLIHLGIEPNRIYIAIIKDEEGNADFWITDEDGSKVSSGFHPNLNDNISFKKMFEGWKNKDKSMTIDMQGEELNKYLTYLAKQNVPFKGGLSQKRRLQYVAYFSKGFIGVASPDETKPETLQLLERFAAVFNLTYTRFNDLLQAEAHNKIIQAENERKTKELVDARELQLSMLPKELPKLPHIDIAVYMNTATEVGGDYYDFNVDDNGTLTFILGDATGHGMMSGMMVSIMKSFFISSRNHIELKHFFEDANNSIKDMKLGRLMMAIVGVQITSTEIIATNAGMPSLVYFRNKSQKAGEFVSNNLPLGGMKETKYMLKSIRYEKGDTLLLMSDGLAELKNSDGEQYGYARIKDEFESIAQKTPEEIIEYLKNSANEWINGVEPDDDVTFVVIKVK